MSREIKSILIVRLSAIGDVIHTLPMLDLLRTEFPDARIGWLVEELSSPLLANHPAIDRVYTIPKKRWRGKYLKKFNSEIRPFFREIKNDKWDVAIDMQGITKSGFAAKASGAKLRVGFAGKNSREINALFVNRRIKTQSDDIHVVQQNIRLVEGLGIAVPETLPKGSLHFTDQELEAMRLGLRETGWRDEKLLAINPGAGFPSKRWPAEYFAELGRLLSEKTSMRPIILWGPGEEDLRDRIAKELEKIEPIVAPKTSVREMAVLISLCSMLIGADTGPSQMAGALSVPVLTLFGGTTGDRNRPWDAGDGSSLYITRSELDCIGCWERRCPLKGDAHMACMNGLLPERVFQEALPWLEKQVVQ